MAKRRQTLKCPVCKIEVKASRLDTHMQKVHPEEEARAQSSGKSVARSLTPAVFAALAVVAVLVVAGVGVYYLNRPEPEENGEPPVVPPSDTGVYPTTYVRMEVGPRGVIIIGLYGNETPNTVQNFINLVNDQHFVGTIFHRIMPGFVIQGGGVMENLEEKPTPFPPIKLEISPKLHNLRGTLSMARTELPDTATTQFFINLVDNTPGKLDPGGYSKEGYAVFGVVVRGMDVADRIATAETEPSRSNPKEVSQPVESERQTLMITNTRMVGTPDG